MRKALSESPAAEGVVVGSNPEAPRGMVVPRYFTTPGVNPADELAWELRSASIKGEDGKAVFEQKDIEVPQSWSMLATNVVASKYFRGTPGTSERETSVRKLVARVVDTIARWGTEGSYFASPVDREAFHAELTHLLLRQKAAFNSPVWFNVGVEAHPQTSACLPYDARVATDKGLIPIGEVVEHVQAGGTLFTWDAMGAPTRITAAVCNGKRTVMALETKDGGVLRLTGDHRVFVLTPAGETVEKFARDVEVGVDSLILSRVALAPQQSPVHFGLVALDEELAWMAGLMVGNGYGGRPESASSDIWEVKLASKDCRDVAKQVLMKHGVPFDVQENSWGVTLRGEGPVGRAFWERMGLWDNTHAKQVPERVFVSAWPEPSAFLVLDHAKQVPEWVFRSGRSNIGSFLRGLFDTSGAVLTATDDSAGVTLYSVSPPVASAARLLLRTLGIYSAQQSFSYSNEGANQKMCHALSIEDGVSVGLFRERVNFTHTEKWLKLSSRSPETKPSRKDAVLVTGYHKGESELVYDIETECHSFWVEGVLVHNCFINSVDDSMESILGLARTEGMLFKYGSGTGSNLSPIRGSKELLAGGGNASGPVSFMRGFDAFAGVIKSGGKCLAPYQKVYTAEGPVDVKTLAERGGDFVALSYDPPSSRYRAKKARAWKEGAKSVVAVLTDKGEFHLSSDHPMKLSTGEYVPAGELKRGMSLFSGTVDQSAGHARVHLRDGTQGTQLLHRLVAADVLGQVVEEGEDAPLVAAEAVDDHRVAEVQRLGVMDTYDVEVDCPTADDKSPQSGHNFLLWSSDERFGSGVVVSNTRRAAKMVILNANHPDILEFIRCKAEEEKKAWALIEAGYDPSFNGVAYGSVYFQNSNNSVRVTDDFMKAVVSDGPWQTHAVRDGKPVETFQARKLFREIAEAAHLCGDPGMQYDTTVNAWHTCSNTARINASNPCQPAWATVLTPQGITTLGSVGDGDTIWSGKQWTRVLKKWSTGRKPVYRYETRAGSFIGTENHRVVERGEKVEVRHAESIDTAQGPGEVDALTWDMQDVVDGLVFGDGRVVVANDGLQHYPVLYVGRDNLGLFASEVAPLVNPTPYDGCAHRVETLLTKAELPHTYLREVPDRYFYAPRAKAAAFLRGLYSANGSVVDGQVTLKATSFKAVEQVQQMLSALGIRSYVTVNPARRAEFSNGTYESRESYDLNVTTDRTRFQSLVGFIQAHKREKLEEACKTLPVGRGPKGTYDVIRREELGEHEVYDITVEAVEHTYWTGGLLVSNCSEYMFLDDSACNLASLNLMHFRTLEGGFDVTAFKHAVSVVLLAQEILVGFSRYPTERIAKNSHDYRPLGLGYANLGALLMATGLPYDSPAGRNYAAAITSLMCGEAYATSARIAAHQGSFAGYGSNASPMLGVIRKHHKAAYQIESEGVSAELLQAQKAAWDDALARGTEHGYRNSQVTVLAPTGTIGFMMDCDTTGIEPDIALIKYKKLVGGGMLKIVNQTVPLALEKLGYPQTQAQDILAHLDEHDTIEGAPHLKPEHLPVFDCAFKPSKGERTIHWMGHIEMMAAVQPFLSGAISKTVNMPTTATVEDIEKAYLEAWKSGLKAVAVYRDGCKRTQPLNTAQDKPKVLGVAEAGPTQKMVPVLVEVPRRRLPDERKAITHKFSIGGHEGYLTVGMYEDGSPGELFVVMAKEGSVVSGLMDSFATSVSLALQYGVPLQVLADKFCHTRYEPSGFTGNPAIPIAKSITDYIFRWLSLKFLPTVEEGSEEESAEGGLARAPVAAQPARESKPTAAPDAAAESRRTYLNQADAPPCGTCGTITVRSGACYKCPNCGSTSGCS